MVVCYVNNVIGLIYNKDIVIIIFVIVIIRIVIIGKVVEVIRFKVFKIVLNGC